MIDSELIFEKEIEIFNEQKQFVIKKKSSSSFFSISKYGNKNILDKIGEKYSSKLRSSKVFSIIGILPCIGTDYLMTVTKAKLVGLFLKSKIWQIEEISFIPFDTDISEEYSEKNKNYFKMITDFIKTNKLFFSDAYNLTASVLENFNKPKMLKTSIRNTIKPEYCWNYNFISTLEYNTEFESMKENFLYPVINGYIGKRLIGDYEKEFNFMIIARKDCRRSGMRYLYRGCDEQGNSANFVEIEEIITVFEEDSYNVLSYIQVRGSIPLLWKQPAEMKLKPKILLNEDYDKQVSVFKKHLGNLVSNYDKVTLVNLIETKGDQKIIGELFENISNETKDEFNQHFVWFDFHKECSKMKYENLNKLLKHPYVNCSLTNFDFTHIQVPSVFTFYDDFYSDNVCIVSQQVGVFRTNCIDSLDRTNVVQTLFARNVLHQMLHRIKIHKMGNCLDAFEPFRGHFEKVFRDMWTDNGDFISMAYSGTPAQKGDFTRTGRRTIKGALRDVYIGGSRFYLNNFIDGYKQDCHDYFLSRIHLYKFIKRKNLTYVKVFLPSFLFVTFFVYLLLTNILNTFSGGNSYYGIFELLLLISSSYVSLITLSSVLKKKMSDKPSNTFI